jgi:hypothetical protein
LFPFPTEEVHPGGERNGDYGEHPHRTAPHAGPFQVYLTKRAATRRRDDAGAQHGSLAAQVVGDSSGAAA